MTAVAEGHPEAGDVGLFVHGRHTLGKRYDEKNSANLFQLSGKHLQKQKVWLYILYLLKLTKKFALIKKLTLWI